jgi:hypothetical protein
MSLERSFRNASIRTLDGRCSVRCMLCSIQLGADISSSASVVDCAKGSLAVTRTGRWTSSMSSCCLNEVSSNVQS